MKRTLKRLFIIGLTGLVISIAALLWANRHVKQHSAGNIYTHTDSIPATNVGLLLGTVKNQQNGQINLYFKYRIEAAAALFKAGKIKHILVSGDNHVKGYDEPEDMRQALIAAGVPDSCITLDYAGFRTLDSVIRCWKVFGQSKFTIISQNFHNERAVFLARHYGLEVAGYNATDVNQHYGLRTRIREYFARVKAALDVYILNKQPKFLGKKEEIAL
ncbi:MAG TPA: ElyC/SanA/YdcF family protein [Bacteroidia bacterium]|nr:ElyC/SanA/YdcF family protein [Bacteroidia bacterium]